MSIIFRARKQVSLRSCWGRFISSQYQHVEEGFFFWLLNHHRYKDSFFLFFFFFKRSVSSICELNWSQVIEILTIGKANPLAYSQHVYFCLCTALCIRVVCSSSVRWLWAHIYFVQTCSRCVHVWWRSKISNCCVSPFICEHVLSVKAGL